MNPPLKSLVGQTFGHLTIVGLATKRTSGNRGRHWECRCSCGGTTIVRSDCLKNGNTTSCGCVYKETRNAMLRHGHCSDYNRTDTYNIWIAMKQRCLNPKNRAYAYYGYRGITVCQQWQDSFEQFYADVGPRPSKKHSIDRINNNGNYEPGNVRWATQQEQLANRSPYKPRTRSKDQQPV